MSIHDILCKHCYQPEHIHNNLDDNSCLDGATHFEPLDSAHRLCRYCAEVDSDHIKGKCLFNSTSFDAFLCAKCHKPVHVVSGMRPEARRTIVFEFKDYQHRDCLYADIEIATGK